MVCVLSGAARSLWKDPVNCTPLSLSSEVRNATDLLDPSPLSSMSEPRSAKETAPPILRDPDRPPASSKDRCGAVSGSWKPTPRSFPAGELTLPLPEAARRAGGGRWPVPLPRRPPNAAAMPGDAAMSGEPGRADTPAAAAAAAARCCWWWSLTSTGSRVLSISRISTAPNPTDLRRVMPLRIQGIETNQKRRYRLCRMGCKGGPSLPPPLPWRMQMGTHSTWSEPVRCTGVFLSLAMVLPEESAGWPGCGTGDDNLDGGGSGGGDDSAGKWTIPGISKSWALDGRVILSATSDRSPWSSRTVTTLLIPTFFRLVRALSETALSPEWLENVEWAMDLDASSSCRARRGGRSVGEWGRGKRMGARAATALYRVLRPKQSVQPRGQGGTSGAPSAARPRGSG